MSCKITHYPPTSGIILRKKRYICINFLTYNTCTMKLKSLFAAIVLAISLPANAGSAYAHLYEGLQFDMPVIDRPAFAGAPSTFRPECGSQALSS